MKKIRGIAQAVMIGSWRAKKEAFNGPDLIPARADENAQTVSMLLTRPTDNLAPLRPLYGVRFVCGSITAAVEGVRGRCAETVIDPTAQALNGPEAV